MKSLIFAVVTALALSACDGTTNYSTDAAGNPVAAPSGGVRDGLLGGLAGFMLGRATAPSYHAPVVAPHPAPVVVRQTIVKQKVVNNYHSPVTRPTSRPSISAPRPSMSRGFSYRRR